MTTPLRFGHARLARPSGMALWFHAYESVDLAQR
jgi:hypothetical protein